MNIQYRTRRAMAQAVALALSLHFISAQAAKHPDAGMRARDLLAHMTLEEKASQLQHDLPPIARLGIPGYNWWNEGLHGVARAGNATVFPQAIGLAASWNKPLVTRVGATVATEFGAKYIETVGRDGSTSIYRGLTVWSPNVNIFRDPRWGRGQETYGEDPYLTSQTGVAYIQGLQANDPLAPAKHLVCIDAVLAREARYRNTGLHRHFHERSLELQGMLAVLATRSALNDWLKICVHD